MKRREVIRNSALMAGAVVAGNESFAQQTGGSGERFGDIVIPPEQEMGKEKHVPVIDAPSTVTAGKAFNVTVTVGKTVPHPNTVEHHIKWIQLYAKDEGSRYAVEVARIDLGPTFASPRITVPVILQKNATLYAVGQCNIHGVWDYSKKVSVS